MQWVILTILAFALCPSFTHSVRLDSLQVASLSADHINYTADKTQRCYSMSCFDNHAALVSWEDLESDGHLFFYDDDDCTSSYVKGYDKSSWALEFSTVNFKDKVSSFMIWQYSVNGIVDICEESTIVNSNSSTSSNEIGINP